MTPTDMAKVQRSNDRRQTMIYCSINLSLLLYFLCSIYILINILSFLMETHSKIIFHIRKLKRKEQNEWRIPTAIGKQTK